MSDAAERGVRDWREEYAYTVGVQAFVFGFPWMYLSSLRYLWTQVPKDPAHTPYAPLNQFWHLRQLADAHYRDGGSPNNDTLYSVAWLELGDEPVILSHPDMGERYFTFEIAGMDSDNFAYVGSRTTGSEAGSFAVVGPDWSGELPPDVTALPRSRTNAVLILGRSLVDGPEDVEAVVQLQDQFRLTSLTAWKTGEPASERPRVAAPPSAEGDPLAPWKWMNTAMAENPPRRHEDLLTVFASVGLGPGLDVDGQDEPTRKGLARAAVAGRELIGRAMRQRGEVRNGWNFPPPTMGRAGDSGDFLTRAAVQCLGGIISNDPEEALYVNTYLDAHGSALSGDNDYVLRFEAGKLPPVAGFWSVTLYGLDANLVDNPVDRYSIGNRTRGLVTEADGALSIRIRSTPLPEHEANWLPSPAGAQFYLILRLYLPHAAAITGAWLPPAIRLAPDAN